MSDLQKFIRQQFFDNHWTRDVDPASLTEEKLTSLDASFCHIDVKSKLCLLLAFSNAKPDLPHEINKHVESIFLQALDEENNLVKAVATILHTKQALGYLNFDISPTNDAFKKNLQRLLKVSDRWCVVQTPLLAEYLGENVLNAVFSGVSPKQDQATIKRPHPSSTYRKRTTRVLGFRPRGKPESVSVKEAYLEKLKDECQRRRVHVPIPGRSFARQDETDELSHTESSGFIGNSTPNRKDSHPTPTRKGVVPHTWNRPPDSSIRKSSAASTPHPCSWSRTGSDQSERTNENRPISLTERLAARTSATANCRKPSGIKLLDFDQLPAFGPKAKQLRKEQMEKEREIKKLEKEERLKEQRAAREAAKLARQSERQAQMDARRHSTPNVWNAVPPPPATDELMADSGEKNDTDANHPPAVSLDTNHHGLSEDTATGDHCLPVGALQSISQRSFGLSSLPNAGSFMVRHPLLSATIGLPNATVAPGVTTVGVDDDEEDDDEDDDDDMMLRDPGTGFYKLGISRDFRGFNPSARISIHGNAVTPAVSSNLQPDYTNNYPFSTVSLASTNVYPLQSTAHLIGLSGGAHTSSVSCLTTQQQQPIQQQAASVLITNNTNPATAHRLIAPRPTIKLVGTSHPNPVIRLIQPTSYNNSNLGLNSAAPVQSVRPVGTLHSLISAPNTLSSPSGDRSNNNHSNSSVTPTYTVGDMDLVDKQTSQSTVVLSPDAQSNSSPSFSAVTPAVRSQQLPAASPTPIRIAPRPSGVRVVRVTNSTALAELRPRIPNSQPNLQQQLQSAPQPRLVNISPAPRVAYITQALQSQLRQTQPQAQTLLLSKNPPAGIQTTMTTTPLSATHASNAHPVNPTWMLDGRSVILTPVITVPGSESPPTIGLLSPPSQSSQACPNSGYIQFVRHPTPGSQTAQILQHRQQQQQQQQEQHQQPQSQQISTSCQSKPTSPVRDTTFVEQQTQPQQTVHSFTAGTGTILENTGSAKFITHISATQPTQLIQPTTHPNPTQLSNQTVLVTNSNDCSTGLASAVKIQDDLCLTEAQVNSVHSLFQGANRVSRPEKAMIVSFIAGARGNPHPEAGNTLRIRLSEYRERVLNQTTGQLMDVAVDTYLHMDYATGKCEKVKYYRNEPPEVLLRLPVQPTTLH